jgi:hypothetical protein
MIIAFVCFLLLPIEISYQPIGNEGLSAIVQVYRTYDTKFNTFPSLHVAFTCYAWFLFRGRKLFVWTAPVALGIIHFIGGLLLGAGVAFRSQLLALRRAARAQ